MGWISWDNENVRIKQFETWPTIKIWPMSNSVEQNLQKFKLVSFENENIRPLWINPFWLMLPFYTLWKKRKIPFKNSNLFLLKMKTIDFHRLTYFWLMFQFYNLWKNPKIPKFFGVFIECKVGTLAINELR